MVLRRKRRMTSGVGPTQPVYYNPGTSISSKIQEVVELAAPGDPICAWWDLNCLEPVTHRFKYSITNVGVRGFSKPLSTRFFCRRHAALVIQRSRMPAPT